MECTTTTSPIAGGVDAGTKEEEAAHTNALAQIAMVQQRAHARVLGLSAVQETETAASCVRELRDV
jgi:hypothetical protein